MIVIVNHIILGYIYHVFAIKFVTLFMTTLSTLWYYNCVISAPLNNGWRLADAIINEPILFQYVNLKWGYWLEVDASLNKIFITPSDAIVGWVIHKPVVSTCLQESTKKALFKLLIEDLYRGNHVCNWWYGNRMRGHQDEDHTKPWWDIQTIYCKDTHSWDHT